MNTPNTPDPGVHPEPQKPAAPAPPAPASAEATAGRPATKKMKLSKSEETAKGKEKDNSKDKGKPGKKSHIEAKLTIRDGEVTIHGKGASTRYRNLTLGAKVDTLEKPVEYSLSVESLEKDRIVM